MPWQATSARLGSFSFLPATASSCLLYTSRNTLDLSAVPVLHNLTHLPVVVDPSHATGVASLVRPMALAAVAAGADGLMIEVHNDPAHAKSDGAQSLTPEAFDEVAAAVRDVRKVVRGEAEA